jgi:hypothetical protein
MKMKTNDKMKNNKLKVMKAVKTIENKLGLSCANLRLSLASAMQARFG